MSKSKYLYAAVLLIVFVILIIGIKKVISTNTLQVIDIIEDLPRSSHYLQRQLSDITGIVIHHSATTGQTAYDFADYHVNHHGWPGIGYHYVIPPEGGVLQTNQLTSISYHTLYTNTPLVAICLPGNFNVAEPSAAQLRDLKKLIKQLKNTLPNQVTLSGHRDHKNTSCPGDNLYPLIQDL